MFEHLQITEPDPRVLQICLNRPRQLNALGKQTIQELTAALEEFDHSGHDVLLLTGAGRAFCFGADFTEFQDRRQLLLLLQLFQGLILKIYESAKITVACLNGFATGAGLDLALACDFRFAVEKAKLGEAYISMGLVSDGGGSFFLSRLIGAGRALELLALGEAISAADAKSLGLVNRVFSSEELASKSLEFAKTLSTKPQTALRQIKKLVKQNSAVDLKTALQNEQHAQTICFDDPVHQSIVQKFLNKRR